MSSNGSRRLPNTRWSHTGCQHDGAGLDRPGNSDRRTLSRRSRSEAARKLELPSGPVEMKVATVRYESLEDSREETGYLIGARILEMSDSDRASFEKYMAKYCRTSPRPERALKGLPSVAPHCTVFKRAPGAIQHSFLELQRSECFGNVEVWFRSLRGSPGQVTFRRFWTNTAKQIHPPQITFLRFWNRLTPRNPHSDQQLFALRVSRR